ncbi:MAG: hypothetical protein IJQ85_10220 [Selenomonadaceae bacterium]|nr:hypothetical protein [Selenomonadaceae bacterium]
MNKPTELENHTGGNPSAGSKSSTTHHIAGSHSSEEPSGKNILQGEGEIKYSIGNDNSAESFKQKITENLRHISLYLRTYVRRLYQIQFC